MHKRAKSNFTERRNLRRRTRIFSGGTYEGVQVCVFENGKRLSRKALTMEMKHSIVDLEEEKQKKGMLTGANLYRNEET